ncbi:hypothetical protein H8959_007838 [Pygathrix nigripes]
MNNVKKGILQGWSIQRNAACRWSWNVAHERTPEPENRTADFPHIWAEQTLQSPPHAVTNDSVGLQHKHVFSPFSYALD